jgi:hypothetical protein
LVINLTDDEIRIYDPSHPNRTRRYPGAVVSGPYSNFFLIDPLVHASIIGVHFRPGRAVSPTNPSFARAGVNRMWSYFFGIGLTAAPCPMKTW